MAKLLLDTEKTYHVYTCANGYENLFCEPENYRYFLKKYTEHIHPVVETFAYCLMPNHLHLMIRVRKEAALKAYFCSRGKAMQDFQKPISKQFANLFSAYTQAYNKRYSRRGSLFNPNFKRKLVDSDAYFTQLMVYIHLNPIHHGFVKDLSHWPHSSWHAYLLDSPTLLARQAGMDWFGDRQRFLQAHQVLKAGKAAFNFDV